MTTTAYLLLIALIFQFNHLWIFGLYRAFYVEFIVDDEPKHGVQKRSKEILWFVSFYAVKWLGKYWSKPVATCPVCMASFHSTYIYWPLAIYFIGFTWWLFPVWILWVTCLAGYNWLKIA